jgi:hypothetical protein
MARRTFSVIQGHSRYPIRADQAVAAYALLVEHVGARDDAMERHCFVHYFVEREGDEYRFQGNLGFGGKFRNNGNFNCTPYVDCYPEDLTEAREAAIKAVNAKLVELFSEE